MDQYVKAMLNHVLARFLDTLKRACVRYSAWPPSSGLNCSLRGLCLLTSMHDKKIWQACMHLIPLISTSEILTNDPSGVPQANSRLLNVFLNINQEKMKLAKKKKKMKTAELPVCIFFWLVLFFLNEMHQFAQQCVLLEHVPRYFYNPYRSKIPVFVTGKQSSNLSTYQNLATCMKLFNLLTPTFNNTLVRVSLFMFNEITRTVQNNSAKQWWQRQCTNNSASTGTAAWVSSLFLFVLCSPRYFINQLKVGSLSPVTILTR